MEQLVDQRLQDAWRMKKEWGEGLTFFHTSKFSEYSYQEIIKKYIKECIIKKLPVKEVFTREDFTKFDDIYSVGQQFESIIRKIFARVHGDYANDADARARAEEAMNNYIACMQGLILPWADAWMEALMQEENGQCLYESINKNDRHLFLLYQTFSRISWEFLRQIDDIVAYYPELEKKMKEEHKIHWNDLYSLQTDLEFEKAETVNKFKTLIDFHSLLHREADPFSVSKGGGDEEPSKRPKIETCMRCGLYIDKHPFEDKKNE